MAVNRNFTENYTLGGGELFIKMSDEDNFRYFGATNEFKINFSSDKLEHKNSESSTLVTDLEVVKEVSSEVSFTTEDLNKKILAMAFGGTYNETSQAAGSVTDMAFTAVKGGYIYELGYLKVSNVVVTYGSNDTEAVEGTDYSVDSEFGKLEIAENSAMVGQDIKVDFDYAAINRVDFTALDKVSREVALRFISHPQVGKAKQTTIHRIQLSLDGDYALKSTDNLTSLSFKGKVLKDSTKPDGKQFIETVMVA